MELEWCYLCLCCWDGGASLVCRYRESFLYDEDELARSVAWYLVSVR